MRRLKNALLTLLTLALVAAGAAMPFAASRWQDARQAGVETQSFDSFLLTLKKKGELNQILRFLHENRYYLFIEDAPANAVMSENEAREAAMEAVEMMFQCGIISKNVMNTLKAYEAEGVDQADVEMARLAAESYELDASAPEVETFAVWGVEWHNMGIQVWLDDASGKAFQISSYNRLWDDAYYDGNASVSSTGMTAEQLYARMDNWRMFLENYYEVEIMDIEEIDAFYTPGFYMYIDLEDGGGPIPVQLHMTEDGETMTVYYVE